MGDNRYKRKPFRMAHAKTESKFLKRPLMIFLNKLYGRIFLGWVGRVSFKLKTRCNSNNQGLFRIPCDDANCATGPGELRSQNFHFLSN